MSFFNDFLNAINIDELADDLMISIVLGKGISIIGKIKLNVMMDNEISFTFKKKNIKVLGDNLQISSISKGEFIVFGNVVSFLVEDRNNEK